MSERASRRRTRGDSLSWKARDLLMEHGLLIWSAATVLCVLAAALAFTRFRAPHQSEVMENWMRAEAIVLRSELAEIDTSDETSFSTRIIARLTLRYLIGGETHETEHVTSWRRRDLRDWSEIFHPGRRIPVRVSPEHPEKISLIDLTGAP